MTEPSELYARWAVARINTFTGAFPDKQNADNARRIVALAIDAALAERIKHCERCGGSWVDDGIQAGCPCGRIDRQRQEIENLSEEVFEEVEKP